MFTLNYDCDKEVTEGGVLRRINNDFRNACDAAEHMLSVGKIEIKAIWF